MVGVLADEHAGDRRLRQQTTFDEPRRCGCLHDGFLAGPARIFGTARH